MKTKLLPRSGSSAGVLAQHLQNRSVVLLLMAYVHGSLNTAETHRRLARIGVEIERDEVGQLTDLAFAEAKRVGA